MQCHTSDDLIQDCALPNFVTFSRSDEQKTTPGGKKVCDWPAWLNEADAAPLLHSPSFPVLS
jgi:hypothetical protein